MLFRPAVPGGRFAALVGGRLTPAVTWVLLGEVGLFVVYAFANGPPWVGEWLAVSGAGLRAGRLWTLATHLAVNLDAGDLIGAGVGLWAFGTPMEHTWGSRRLLWFMAATGVAGALAAGLAGAIGLHGRLAGAAAPSLALAVAWTVHFGALRVRVPGGAAVRCRHLGLFVLALVGISHLLSGLDIALVGVAAGAGAAFAITTGRWPDPRALLRRARRRLGVLPGGRADRDRWIN